MEDYRNNMKLQVLKKIFGKGLIWLAVALFFFFLVLFTTIRVGRVKGTEVGVVLNKINGKMSVVNQSGVRIYNGITKDFYVLDKTMQTLVMTEDPSKGDRKGRDDLKIKTVDGSDVYVDLKIQYKIFPDMADVVLKTSGPGDLYKKKWARDYIR